MISRPPTRSPSRGHCAASEVYLSEKYVAVVRKTQPILAIHSDKLIEGSNSEGYKLTQIGHSEAEKILARCLAESS
jgi:hypothetical protein